MSLGILVSCRCCGKIPVRTLISIALVASFFALFVTLVASICTGMELLSIEHRLGPYRGFHYAVDRVFHFAYAKVGVQVRRIRLLDCLSSYTSLHGSFPGDMLLLGSSDSVHTHDTLLAHGLRLWPPGAPFFPKFDVAARRCVGLVGQRVAAAFVATF